MSGKLSGGHQAAVMCMAVGKLTNEEDLVITGSKDHYIKVFITSLPSSFTRLLPMEVTDTHIPTCSANDGSYFHSTNTLRSNLHYLIGAC